MHRNISTVCLIHLSYSVHTQFNFGCMHIPSCAHAVQFNASLKNSYDSRVYSYSEKVVLTLYNCYIRWYVGVALRERLRNMQNGQEEGMGVWQKMLMCT